MRGQKEGKVRAPRERTQHATHKMSHEGKPVYSGAGPGAPPRAAPHSLCPALCRCAGVRSARSRQREPTHLSSRAEGAPAGPFRWATGRGQVHEINQRPLGGAGK